MAGSIERSLNELFSSNLTSADEDRYSAVIQDYFCFESEIDEESDINDDYYQEEYDENYDLDDNNEATLDTDNLLLIEDDVIVQTAIPAAVQEHTRHEDQEEADIITEFIDIGCQCQKKCSKKFPRHHYELIRSQCAELTREMLDMVVLGQLMTLTTQLGSTIYMHQGEKICKSTFQFLHGIGKKRLSAIKCSYHSNSLEPRIHGNKHKQPHNALSVNDVMKVVTFIRNHAEDHAILLPGRIPGYNRYDIKLLPSSSTKLAIWEAYRLEVETLVNARVVGYRSFRNTWTKYLPDIIITKPMSDLCFTCQKNNTFIQRSSNKPEEEKSKALKLAEKHLLAVSKERNYFRTVVKSSKDTMKRHFTNDSVYTPPSPHCCLPPLSNDICMHYSFDFAQQVHYPSNPLQPGPIYFLTPRKCGIFGICCEATPRQINYLIDEAVDVGKGANTVVSLIHHFFETHGLGEKHVHLHADNCVGQNKNNTMMHYLMWRVMKGLHHSITISFMLVGHTKFSPDWCFGLLKRKFRKSKVDCLDDLVKVVNSSADVNEVQLVGDQMGESIVPMYDWVGLFGSRVKKIPLITHQHHFTFVSTSPGKVVVREYNDTDETEFLFTSDQLLANEFPDVITPPGLSLQRRWYLHDKIREFCQHEVRDVVCPRPVTPLPKSTPQPRSSVSNSSVVTQPKARTCGGCGKTGHNKRTCPTLLEPVEDLPGPSITNDQ